MIFLCPIQDFDKFVFSSSSRNAATTANNEPTKCSA